MKKKVQAIFPQIQRWSSFLPKHCAQIDKKTLLDSCITHRATTTKIAVHRTNHGNAQFCPTQQPTNNPAFCDKFSIDVTDQYKGGSPRAGTSP
jgi:hypothetical protein